MEGYSNASGHTHNNGNLTFIFFFSPSLFKTTLLVLRKLP